MTAPPSVTTLRHYTARADQYAHGLMTLDTGDSRRRFLARLPAPADILDLGCGPGRDLAAFAAAGHRACGIDGCPALAAQAGRRSGRPVGVQDLARDPGLPAQSFDGVFAHDLFFHIPDPLPLLRAVADSLRQGGVFYACDPTGDNVEGLMDGERWVAFRRPQRWKSLARQAGFTLLEEWRRPLNAPRHRQDWLATLWRRA